MRPLAYLSSLVLLRSRGNQERDALLRDRQLEPVRVDEGPINLDVVSTKDERMAGRHFGVANQRIRGLAHALGVYLALATLAGCSPKGSQTYIPMSQPANIIAVQPDPSHLVGPPFPPPSTTYPLTISILSGNNQVAPVGSYCSLPLSVLVLDGNGKPVQGAYVQFVPEKPGDCYGLGSASTDAKGEASVAVGPAVYGTLYVRAFADKDGLHTAPGVSFSVTGF